MSYLETQTKLQKLKALSSAIDRIKRDVVPDYQRELQIQRLEKQRESLRSTLPKLRLVAS